VLVAVQRLKALPDLAIARALGRRPPLDWYVSMAERVTLARYLADRRDAFP
jgi:hypothetical protein